MLATCLTGALCAAAAAELGDVVLRDGTRLRGDIEVRPTEVLVRNEAGQVAIPREQVAEIRWSGREPTASMPTTSQPDGQPGGQAAARQSPGRDPRPWRWSPRHGSAPATSSACA